MHGMALACAHQTPRSGNVFKKIVRSTYDAICASILRALVAADVMGLMFYHQAGLCEREEEDQGDDAPDFE
jgi:hypothetical protein